MARVFVLLIFAVLALIVVALIDCVATRRSEVRTLPKLLWLLVILLVPPVGPVGWFLVGRPRPDLPLERAPLRRPVERRSVAPDDNPEFLRSLSISLKEKRDDEGPTG